MRAWHTPRAAGHVRASWQRLWQTQGGDPQAGRARQQRQQPAPGAGAAQVQEPSPAAQVLAHLQAGPPPPPRPPPSRLLQAEGEAVHVRTMHYKGKESMRLAVRQRSLPPQQCAQGGASPALPDTPAFTVEDRSSSPSSSSPSSSSSSATPAPANAGASPSEAGGLGSYGSSDCTRKRRRSQGVNVQADGHQLPDDCIVARLGWRMVRLAGRLRAAAAPCACHPYLQPAWPYPCLRPTL